MLTYTTNSLGFRQALNERDEEVCPQCKGHYTNEGDGYICQPCDDFNREADLMVQVEAVIVERLGL